jgi:alpha-ketoglutarate-dependent taurine dioxygenase
MSKAIPDDELDFEACVKISNGKITKEAFDQFKNDVGLFSKKKLIELCQKTDCFLTHDWYDNNIYIYNNYSILFNFSGEQVHIIII